MEAIIETLSAMSAGQLVGGGALLTAGLSTIIQVSPIKIDPWTILARKVGRAINGEVLARMDQIESRVDSLNNTVEERAAKDARTRILRFGDECLHGDKHSKEHFDQILRDITEYEQYCDDHPEFMNNMAVLTIDSIKSSYQDRLRLHDFL